MVTALSGEDRLTDDERFSIAADAERRFDFQRSHVGRGVDRSLVWKIRQPVVPLAKKFARLWGMVTAGARPLPDFLLIGAKRAGSTTLYRGLASSGGIEPMWPRFEDRKGCYFFDVHHGRGSRWYRSHMPTKRTRTGLLGEATPYYLSHPLAAQRAHALMPESRIIVALRDPIERAYSHYRERLKQGIEPLTSFAEALEAEEERLDGEVERMLDDELYVSWNHLNFGYVAQSRYGENLKRWTDAYGDEQVHVVKAEDLYSEPGLVIQEVRRFLSLSDAAPTDVEHLNFIPHSEMDPSLREWLRSSLEGDVRDLERQLGRNMDWSL